MQSAAPARQTSTDLSEDAANPIIGFLKDDGTPDYLRVESDDALVGVYAIVGGTLTYRSGPKVRTGEQARKYLSVDTKARGSSLYLVGAEEAGPFTQDTASEGEPEAAANTLSAAVQD